MSYARAVDRKAIINHVLLDYTSVAEAPQDFDDPEVEGQKRYKAVSNSGNVYLVQNPNVWLSVYYTRDSGAGQPQTFVKRLKPELIYTYEKAKDEAAKKSVVAARAAQRVQKAAAGGDGWNI